MRISTCFKIGHHEFTVVDDYQKTQDFVKKISFYFDLPKECGNCGGDDLVPCHRSPKNKKGVSFEAYSILCRNCFFQLKLGQRADESGLFVNHKDGWVKFGTDKSDKRDDFDPPPPSDEDIPF